MIWRTVREPGGRTAQVARRGRAQAKVKHLPRRGWQVFGRKPGGRLMRRVGYPMTSEHQAKHAAERWLRQQGDRLGGDNMRTTGQGRLTDRIARQVYHALKARRPARF